MSNETYRQFDPWRPSPVKEISRRQIVETHYSVSYTHLTLPTTAYV